MSTSRGIGKRVWWWAGGVGLSLLFVIGIVAFRAFRVTQWITAIERAGGSVVIEPPSEQSLLLPVSLGRGLGRVLEVSVVFDDPSVAPEEIRSLTSQLRYFSGLKKLRFSGPFVTNADLNCIIEHTPQITELSLWEATRITDWGLSHVSKLSELRDLDLGFTQVSDDIAVSVACCQKLRTLTLVDTRITDRGLENLRTLTRLRALDLGGTAITDAGLSALVNMKELEELYLGGTKISDAALTHIEKIETLRRLAIRGTDMTIYGVARLRFVRPALTIENDHNQ